MTMMMSPTAAAADFDPPKPVVGATKTATACSLMTRPLLPGDLSASFITLPVLRFTQCGAVHLCSTVAQLAHRFIHFTEPCVYGTVRYVLVRTVVVGVHS